MLLREVVVSLHEDQTKNIRALYMQTEESFNITAPAYMQYVNIILFPAQKIREEWKCLPPPSY